MLVPWNSRMDFQEAVMKGEVRGIETSFDVSTYICSQKRALDSSLLEFLYECESADRSSEQ